MTERHPRLAPGALSDTPPPPERPDVTLLTWPRGTPIHRIHLADYGADQFNPGLRGNARFSPIRTRTDAPIPTLYGGTSFDGAAMETVFHDVPFAPGLKTLDRRRLRGQVHSVLVPQQDLRLVDLGNVALRRLGVSRVQLIETEKSGYPATRRWAEAIHAAHPDVQGLCWVSRQHDREQALMLYGDRVPPGALAPQGASSSLLEDAALHARLVDLADRLGVWLIDGGG